MTERDLLNHTIAETIGCTVWEVENRMSGREWRNWCLFIARKNGQNQTQTDAFQELAKWQP